MLLQCLNPGFHLFKESKLPVQPTPEPLLTGHDVPRKNIKSLQKVLLLKKKVYLPRRALSAPEPALCELPRHQYGAGNHVTSWSIASRARFPLPSIGCQGKEELGAFGNSWGQNQRFVRPHYGLAKLVKAE